MKLTEFSLDKELSELGERPGQQPHPQQVPKGPDPREMAFRAQEVAAKKMELQKMIQSKQLEIVELRKQLASIR